MKRKIILPPWIVEIDPEATRTALERAGDDCQCALCRNARLAFSHLPKLFIDFMRSNDLNPFTPVHISEVCTNPDGTHYYCLYYNIIGRIISGPDYRKNNPPAPRGKPIENNSSLGVSLHICSDVSVPGHISGEAIELDILSSLPWILGEKP